MPDNGDPFSLGGRVAVVTGGGGVLCGAMARGLAARGARVAVLGRTAASLERVAAGIAADGGEALAVACDVLDPAALAVAYDRVAAAFGVPDILVNGAGGSNADAVTAGVAVDDPTPPTFFDLSPAALRGVMDLNFMGTVLPCQVFGRAMVARGRARGGAIINVASMASYRPATRVPGYSSAKAAIVNFTQWLAVHFAPAGVRVNAIAPGFFLTEQNRHLLLDAATGGPSARGERILEHTPMDRLGDADDLVGAAVYLAGDAARFVTGSVLAVDGGFSVFGGV